MSHPRSKFRFPLSIRPPFKHGPKRAQLGVAIFNPQHSNPDEEELWNTAKSAEGAERADALVKLSYIAHQRKDFTECLALCESAKEIYESLGAETGNEVLAHVYSGISYSLSEMQRNEEALQSGQKVIELLEEVGSPDVLKAYRDEASFAFDAKNYEESLKWYQKALQYISPDDTDFNKAWDHFHVARSLLKLERYEESIQQLKTAREMFKKEKNLRAVTFCDEELALAYIRMGDGNFAIAHAELAMDYAVTAEDEVRAYWANIRYAQACELTGAFQTSYDCYKEAKSWEVSDSKYTYWPHVFALELRMADCLEALDQLNEANEIRRRINAMSESLGQAPEMP